MAPLQHWSQRETMPLSFGASGACSLLAIRLALVLTLGLLIPLSCQERTVCNTCSLSSSQGEPALGFNLGQSYG